MIKLKKTICLILVIATIGLVVVSCSSSKPDPIIGEWAYELGNKYMEEVITFFASGKAYKEGGKYHGDGTWEKVSDGKYVMVIYSNTYGSQKIDVTLKNNTITLDDDWEYHGWPVFERK